MKFNFTSNTSSRSIISMLNDDWMNLSNNILFEREDISPRVRKFRPEREDTDSGYRTSGKGRAA